MLKSRKMGKFTVGREIIDDHADVVKSIMGTLIVVRAEFLFAEDSVEYVAVCDDFDEFNEGEVLPTYDVVVDSEEGTITWSRAG
jgi:hypothetical protein